MLNKKLVDDIRVLKGKEDRVEVNSWVPLVRIRVPNTYSLVGLFLLPQRFSKGGFSTINIYLNLSLAFQYIIFESFRIIT